MSHITDFSNMETIVDRDALRRAIERFCPTLEYVEGESHYRTWKDDHNGNLVGDYPVPEGWTKEEVGENAVDIIRVKPEHNKNGKAYEIGIVPNKQKPGHYNLITDFWAQGNGLLTQPGVGKAKKQFDEKTGKTKDRAFDDLLMHYAMMEDELEAERQGDTIEFSQNEKGEWLSVITTQRV